VHLPSSSNTEIALEIIQLDQNLPEDQCIFIRGFRVSRFWGILPRLRGAAGSMQSPDEDEDEPRMQLISNPTETNVTLYIWDIWHLSDFSKVQ
jgi:hypothetical protein